VTRRNGITRVARGLAIVLVSAGPVVVSATAASAPAPASQTPLPAGLPAAVLKAFQQAYPGATISAMSLESNTTPPAFRVEGLDKGRRRIVSYKSSGTVIQVAEQIDERELPPPVAAAMHSHPRAIYVTGMKVTRGGIVLYELTLRGTRKTVLIAKPDGTVVSFK